MELKDKAAQLACAATQEIKARKEARDRREVMELLAETATKELPALMEKQAETECLACPVFLDLLVREDRLELREKEDTREFKAELQIWRAELARSAKQISEEAQLSSA